jgi:hypothetical protein
MVTTSRSVHFTTITIQIFISPFTIFAITTFLIKEGELKAYTVVEASLHALQISVLDGDSWSVSYYGCSPDEMALYI